MERTRQDQSINQGVRMIGSINDKYGTQARAYRTGERVSIEYLNGYLTRTKLCWCRYPKYRTNLSRCKRH